MSFAFWRGTGESWMLSMALFRTAFWMGLCGLVAAQGECPESSCRIPRTSVVTNHNGVEPCYESGTALRVQCQSGFRRRGEDADEYVAVCRLDGTWEWSDSCQIDILTVIIAGVVALVALCAFFVIMYCILGRKKPAAKGEGGKDKKRQKEDGKDKKVQNEDAIADAVAVAATETA